MGDGHVLHPDEMRPLDSVTVIYTHPDEKINPWIDAIKDAGAIFHMEDSVTNAIQETSQKIAIIIGQTGEENILSVLEKFEEIFSDPSLSIRYFYFLKNKESIAINEHYRGRNIHYMAIAPNAVPEIIKRSLYKSRLPRFLRTGYEIEICDELREYRGEKYRKIIIQSFDGKGDLNYITTNLYIHNKELHQWNESAGEMIQKNPTSLIDIQKGRYNGFLNLDQLRNADQEE